jgi:hypothetical protein
VCTETTNVSCLSPNAAARHRRVVEVDLPTELVHSRHDDRRKARQVAAAHIRALRSNNSKPHTASSSSSSSPSKSLSKKTAKSLESNNEIKSSLHVPQSSEDKASIASPPSSRPEPTCIDKNVLALTDAPHSPTGSGGGDADSSVAAQDASLDVTNSRRGLPKAKVWIGGAKQWLLRERTETDATKDECDEEQEDTIILIDTLSDASSGTEAPASPPLTMGRRLSLSSSSEHAANRPWSSPVKLGSRSSSAGNSNGLDARSEHAGRWNRRRDVPAKPQTNFNFEDSIMNFDDTVALIATRSDEPEHPPDNLTTPRARRRQSLSAVSELTPSGGRAPFSYLSPVKRNTNDSVGLDARSDHVGRWTRRRAAATPAEPTAVSDSQDLLLAASANDDLLYTLESPSSKKVSTPTDRTERCCRSLSSSEHGTVSPSGSKSNPQHGPCGIPVDALEETGCTPLPKRALINESLHDLLATALDHSARLESNKEDRGETASGLPQKQSESAVTAARSKNESLSAASEHSPRRHHRPTGSPRRKPDKSKPDEAALDTRSEHVSRTSAKSSPTESARKSKRDETGLDTRSEHVSRTSAKSNLSESARSRVVSTSQVSKGTGRHSLSASLHGSPRRKIISESTRPRSRPSTTTQGTTTTTASNRESSTDSSDPSTLTARSASELDDRKEESKTPDATSAPDHELLSPSATSADRTTGRTSTKLRSSRRSKAVVAAA